ncbi:hypothetical protein SKAU_G00194310 [Synaphobranchus kaupii]|uniref:Ubiquitin-like protease family profile domain-containing protein n=1 Tax=Synaphobranchus kaupii TaxID=118154 RepID=A0A9Q1FE75_SYNKA|nr:hypothetical protein SKAU_G00194310 [Synaphobranchus kaupii]
MESLIINIFGDGDGEVSGGDPRVRNAGAASRELTRQQPRLRCSGDGERRVAGGGPARQTAGGGDHLATVNCDPCCTGVLDGRKKEVIWSKVGPYKVFTLDILSTAPGNYFVDEVLNAYLELKVQETSKTTKAFLIDCFAMMAIWQGNLKGLRKLEPDKFHILLGAVNENHHWTLVVMYPQQRRALYLDPFGALPAAIEKCKNATRTALEDGGAGRTAQEGGGDGCIAMEAGGDGCIAVEAGGDGCIAVEAGGDGCIAVEAGGDGCIAEDAGGDGCIAVEAGGDGCIAVEAGGE